MAKKKVNDYGTGIPYHEVEALARVLLPEIQAFFERGGAERICGVESAEGHRQNNRGINEARREHHFRCSRFTHLDNADIKIFSR